MAEGEAWLELLKRRLAELDALRATYPEIGALLTNAAEELALSESVAAAEQGVMLEHWGGRPPSLSFTLALPGLKLGGVAVGLRVVMPPGYPSEAEPPELMPQCPRAHSSALGAAMREVAGAAGGEECVLQAAWALQEACGALVAAEQAQAEAVAEESSPSPAPVARIGRRTIWFHHIKSTMKRKHIVEWAGELRLGGYSKPGYPGVIVCEGDEDDVAEFVARLRALQWKAMAVRAEEVEECEGAGGVDAHRRLQAGWLELGEHGLGEMAEACREGGLAHLFLAAMKLPS